MNLFQEIIAEFPNFMNNDYTVGCNLNNEEEIKAPFVRILPKFFSIENVRHVSKRDGCYYRVKYNFNDANDLPTGCGLKPLVKQVKKHWPCNTLIVDDDIELPKSIVITYAVCCHCNPLDFDAPMQTANVWAMQKTFKKFHI